MEQGLGGGFVTGAKAFLFAVLGILSVVNAIAAIEAEQLFHNITISAGNVIRSDTSSLLSRL